MSNMDGNEDVKTEREDITNSIILQDDGDFKEEMLTELQFVVDCSDMGSAQDWPASSEYAQMKREVCLEAEQQYASEFVSFEDKESGAGKRSLLERIESLISENDRIIQTVENTQVVSNGDVDEPPNKKINIVSTTTTSSNYDNSALERIETIINQNDRIVHTSDRAFEGVFTNKNNRTEYNDNTLNKVIITTPQLEQNIDFKILENTGQITLRCDICSAFFSTCQELEIHLQSHSQVTQCVVCFNLFMSDSNNEICSKCQENATETVYIEDKRKEEIIYQTVIISEVATGDIKQEEGIKNSDIIIPDLRFQCLDTNILNDNELLDTSNYESYEISQDIKTTSINEESTVISSPQSSQYATENSITKSPPEPIPCSSKEDVLERIDRIINKNTKIMHESKIPKSFPKQTPPVKKDQILNRIEKIIEKNANVLDSTKVQTKSIITQINCTECGLNFISDNLYQEHIRMAHNFTFPCLICCSQFSSITVFNEHLKNIHKICKACNEAFKTHQEFNHHENCHKYGLIKFYQCQICYNDFKKLDALIEHMESIHSMQQPYPVKTVKKYLLNNISSTTLDLLQCVYCDVKFTKSEQLDDHLNLQHGVENASKIV